MDSNERFDLLLTIRGLEHQAINVEQDGHLNAARHMRNAAEMLRLVVEAMVETEHNSKTV